METEAIRQIVETQRAWFETGATLSPEGRKAALLRLRAAMIRHERSIQQALRDDLGKCEMESLMCETGLALSELGYMQRHLERFSRDRRVHTALANFPARSLIRPKPYGVVLIMSPWNYPYLLTMEPLIDAIAAGNTVVVKPSAYAPHTAQALQTLLAEALPEELCAVVPGGRAENQGLLHQKFDYIFFTGSQAVGKEVLRQAAERLTPCTLELGGKSPVVVDATADIPLAARRIVFGKFLNCGQTCVAPDYVLCQAEVKDRLIWEIIREIRRQIGDRPFENPEYGHMVNQKHFDRVLGLIAPEKTVWGGQSDPQRLQIAPTVMDRVSWDDPVMGQEIFGPVLPILTIRRAEDAIALINRGQRPLALYVFTRDRATARLLTTRCAFGGGCVNDTIMHLTASNMPFGGVGESGMGAYHGKAGFDTFTHFTSILDRKTWADVGMRYRPYTALGKSLARRVLK